MEQKSVDTITLQGIIRSLVGVLCFGIVVFLLWYFSAVVVYILVSAVLAVMFRPLVNYLSKLRIKDVRVSRSVAAILSLFAIWAIFGALFSSLLPLIFSKINQLANLDLLTVFGSIEQPLLDLQHYVQDHFSLSDGEFSLRDSLMNWVGSVVDFKTINSAFSSVLGLFATMVISFFSVSFITFFFLKDDHLFESMVTSLFPPQYNDSVVRALNSISYLLSRYFVGLICESVMIATAISVVMICFGMRANDALFMGVVMGVMNVIPYAGPFMGACFSIFLGVVTPIEALGVGSTVLVIALSLAIIKGMDDFLLQPTLYSERVKAHPLEVFIVILMSGYVAGVVGMLLAIPSYTVLRVFAKEFFSQFSLVRMLTKEL